MEPARSTRRGLLFRGKRRRHGDRPEGELHLVGDEPGAGARPVPGRKGLRLRRSRRFAVRAPRTRDGRRLAREPEMLEAVWCSDSALAAYKHSSGQ
jgi:hypothetical protein